MRYRTHNCNELTKENIGQEVKLAGFVQRKRNFGKVLFVDLRDNYGITQLLFRDEKHIKMMEKIAPESTISITGVVSLRESANPKLKTGDIEVIVSDLELLGSCHVNLPFEVNDSYKNNREDLRLEYRYLDLRNQKIHENIIKRARILQDMRDYMNSCNFVEVQTPIFANSSPEGARDYLIPSRLHKGEFYALPQAPQQFKQLLMMSAFDKYYQIAPCFRDEDPRADRSPCEFYQLDFEMSFVTQEDVFKVLEGLFEYVFSRNTDYKIDKGPFKRIKYFDSLELYGTDKPDLRNKLFITNVSEFVGDIPLFENNDVYMIKVPQILGRKQLDNLTELVRENGANLAWFKKQDGLSGSIAKFLNDEILENFDAKYNANMDKLIQNNYTNYNKEDYAIGDEYTAMLVFAPKNTKANSACGLLRNEVANLLDIVEKDAFRFCIILDFPMYELTDEGKLDFAHNPFSMPQVSKDEIENTDPLTILAYQYDVVCNGFEVTSGAVRNHDVEMMEKVFKVVGYDKEEIEKRFKALYTAFQYGAPPHAGAAPGIDRIVMLLCNEDNLREVIAFPKNKKARDLMVGAPSFVSQEQLDELHIKIID